MLNFLSFTKEEIDAANIHVCGSMTLEGAPHLNEEHLNVFDCANVYVEELARDFYQLIVI